jgi:hypothetical protein
MRLKLGSNQADNFRESDVRGGGRPDGAVRPKRCEPASVHVCEGDPVKSKRKQGIMLFTPESAGACRVIRRVSHEEALEKEALGFWERVYDGCSGELMGFRLKARQEDDSSMQSQPTSAAIVASEMELNAFARVFRDAQSHTIRLKEEDRLSREKRGADAEDKAERTMAKVFVWPKVGAAKGDILRAWPRGVA